MVALMRVVLSVSGLAVVTLVPAGPEHLTSPVSLALVAYAVYSIAVWVFDVKGIAPTRALSDWGHWIDVVFYTSLIALSRGTVSIFFWYFFPILVASFGGVDRDQVVLTSAASPRSWGSGSRRRVEDRAAAVPDPADLPSPSDT
jgi:hypothetical protein